MGSVIAFVGISALVIVTPGPDTAITIKNTLGGSWRSGIATAAGVASGQTVWTLAAAAGVTALVVASETAFLVLKVVGAGYLAFLGLRSILDGIRGTDQYRARPTASAGRVHPRSAYRQGLISDLANPKMAAFFTSILPQFAPDSSVAFLALVGFGLVFAAMTFSWLALYATVLERLGELFRASAVRRTIDVLLGAVLVALGARIAVIRE